MISMIVMPLSSINADGFSVVIKDEDKNLFNKNYYYGWEASYSRRFAEMAHEDVVNAKKYGWTSPYVEKPFVSDILTELSTKYKVEQIYVSAGKNALTDTLVSNETVRKFIEEYIAPIDELYFLFCS